MFNFFNFTRKNNKTRNFSNEKRILRLENLEDRQLLTVSNPAALAAEIAPADITEDDTVNGIFYLRGTAQANFEGVQERISMAGWDEKAWNTITVKFDPKIFTNDTIRMSETIELKRSYALDLDGKTLDANGDRMFTLTATDGFIVKNGTLTGAKASSGAIVRFSDAKSFTFENCTIYGNKANNNDEDDPYNGMGAVALVEGGTLNMFGCTVYNNEAVGSGGVIFALSGSDRTKINLESSVFYLNHANEFGGVVEAMYCDLNVVNCTMAGNWAKSKGGAILVFNYTGDSSTIYSTTNVYNSIIAYNESAGGDSNKDLGLYSMDETTGFTKRYNAKANIISQTGDYFFEAPDLTVTYNWETGEIINIECINADSIDLRVGSDSITINEGVSGKNTYAKDAWGQTRRYGGYVDIGAYEYQGSCTGTYSTVVTTLSDRHVAGKTTLREALLNANRQGNDGTITFASNLSGTVVLNSELVHTNGSVTIVGDGRITLDGDNTCRVLYVDGLFKETNDTVALNLSGLKIQNGYATGGNYGSYGGGLWAAYGVNVTIDSCTFQNNTIYGHGTSGVCGGAMAITMDSNLVMTNSTITNNTAKIDYCSHDYMIYRDTDPETGEEGATTIFYYRTYRALGGGIYIGNGTHYSWSYLGNQSGTGTADIRNCTISYNKALAAEEDGTASYGNIAMGGGIYAATSCAAANGFILYNSDLSYNKCVGGNISATGEKIGEIAEQGEDILAGNGQGYKWTKGGGLYIVGRNISSYVTADVRYCTITHNELVEWGNHRGDLEFLGQGYAWGAGVCNMSSFLTFVECLITDNVITGDVTYGNLMGGGIYSDFAMIAWNTTIANNIIHNNDNKNSSEEGGRQTYGVGICNGGTYGSELSPGCPTLVGCILMDNTYTLQETIDYEQHAGERPEIVYIDEIVEDAFQDGVAFTLNASLYRSSGLRVGEIAPDFVITDSIAWKSDYALFNNAEEGDYTLCAGSIAIDVIDPNADPLYKPWGEYDLRGQGYLRVVNSLMDLGCYEYQGSEPVIKKLAKPNIAAAVEGTAITVSWDAVANASGYVVYSSTDSANWSQVATANTSYTFSGLASGTTYYYKVIAKGDGTNYTDSDFSNIVNAATPTVMNLATPTNVTAAVYGDTTIFLYWVGDSHAGAYNIGYSTDQTNWTYVTNNTTNYMFNTLSPSTTYYFKVQAIDGGQYQDSAFSESISAKTTGKEKLAAPSITAILSGETVAVVYWAAIPNAASYTVYYSADNTTWSKTSTTSTNVLISGLKTATTYTIKAKAVPTDTTTYAESDFSNVATITTGGASEQLSAPTNVAYATYGANRATITWDTVANAASYVVEYSYNNFMTLQTVDTTTNSAIVTGLTYATTFSYRVKAIAAAGSAYSDSDYSATISKVCCPSDINSDGKINLKDYTIFSGAYMKQTGFDVRANINGKSIVNVADWGFMSANYGKTATDPTIVNPAALASAVDTLDLDFVEEIAEDYDIDIDLDVF